MASHIGRAAAAATLAAHETSSSEWSVASATITHATLPEEFLLRVSTKARSM